MHTQHTALGPLPYSASARAIASSPHLAIYARVSGSQQEKEDTIASQVAELKAAIAACGGTLVEGCAFRDNPYSGTTSSRPGLDRLMAAARAKKFDALLIHDPDRLARGEPWLRPLLEKQIRDEGITLAYLFYEAPDTPEGRVMDRTLGNFDEYFREKVVGNMERGKRDKLNNGHIWRGRDTFGWVYHKPDKAQGHKHGVLEHHPVQAPVVRDIITRAAAGLSTRQIADDLNRDGEPTITGKPWDPRTVAAIIHNPLHGGLVVVNRYEVVQSADNRKRRPDVHTKRTKSSNRKRPRDEWAVIDADTLATNGIVITPIVSPELQASAEAALLRNRQFSPRHAKRDYPLRGLVFCMMPRHDDPSETCGRRMTGMAPRGGLYREYRCSRYYPSKDNPGRCTTVRSADALERAVWDHIKDVLQEPDMLRKSLEMAEESGSDERIRAERALEHAHAALHDAEQALDGLIDLAARTRMDTATFERKQADYVSRRDAAQHTIADVTALVQGARLAGKRWQTIKHWLDDLRALLDKADAPGNESVKTHIIRTLTYRIEIDAHETRYIGWLESDDGAQRSIAASISSDCCCNTFTHTLPTATVPAA